MALRERGFPVEYILAPDEGHGFARPVNNMAAFAAAERFLAEHLDGRFQEGGTPEVVERLEEITVDPDTVELPEPVDLSSIAAPTPVARLEAGTHSYAVSMEGGGQSLELSSSIDIAEDGDSWLVTETTATPAGEATERTMLSKEGLEVRSRDIMQGPVEITLDVDDGTVSGEMSMGGQASELSVPLDGALFADGAGAGHVIATLPLEEGYETAFRNLNLQPPGVRTVELAVVGSESVTVPAGMFDTLVVELTSPDDGNRTTLWIADDSRRVVKTVTTGPVLNGGVVTTELK